jgi:hypothetical protein
MAVFKSKQVEYTDPLQDAVNASNDALSIFLKAGEDLDLANDSLKIVIDGEKAAIARAQERVTLAECQITGNDTVKDKIDSLLSD